ncbi:hypothetical protein CSV86_008885 [Pseudomonas putida CSV86]|uniref:Uncharacterized protein n=1 Tax=Pseudomonas bharatica CSV86 TaxID=1005395 RepID=A0A7K4ECH7_9PSED|nr:hypothetical protein [Pseudomonas bharatica]NNJ15344.1 hypothetical protein [Pseudomonas bharatica CSV86]
MLNAVFIDSDSLALWFAWNAARAVPVSISLMNQWVALVSRLPEVLARKATVAQVLLGEQLPGEQWPGEQVLEKFLYAVQLSIKLDK